MTQRKPSLYDIVAKAVIDADPIGVFNLGTISAPTDEYDSEILEIAYLYHQTCKFYPTMVLEDKQLPSGIHELMVVCTRFVLEKAWTDFAYNQQCSEVIVNSVLDMSYTYYGMEKVPDVIS